MPSETPGSADLQAADLSAWLAREYVPEAQYAPPAKPEFDAYRATVRLLVGGTIEGAAELARRLEEWERRIREAQMIEAKSPAEETPSDLARYAVVGLVLETAEFFRRRVPVWLRLSDLTVETTGRMVTRLPFTGFIGRRYDELVARGMGSVDRWIAVGRAEEPTSRAVARLAVEDVINDIVSYLAENPEVAELVQNQSIGLAGEVVDQVRGRTVTADTLAERVVRRVLRRTPREQLPPPPLEVQQAVIPPDKTTTRRD